MTRPSDNNHRTGEAAAMGAQIEVDVLSAPDEVRTFLNSWGGQSLGVKVADGDVVSLSREALETVLTQLDVRSANLRGVADLADRAADRVEELTAILDTILAWRNDLAEERGVEWTAGDVADRLTGLLFPDDEPEELDPELVDRVTSEIKALSVANPGPIEPQQLALTALRVVAAWQQPEEGDSPSA